MPLLHFFYLPHSLSPQSFILSFCEEMSAFDLFFLKSVVSWEWGGETANLLYGQPYEDTYALLVIYFVQNFVESIRCWVVISWMKRRVLRVVVLLGDFDVLHGELGKESLCGARGWWCETSWEVTKEYCTLHVVVSTPHFVQDSLPFIRPLMRKQRRKVYI